MRYRWKSKQLATCIGQVLIVGPTWTQNYVGRCFLFICSGKTKQKDTRNEGQESLTLEQICVLIIRSSY